MIGYGVAAINPYLALETVRDLQARKRLGDITPEQAEKNYIKAAVGGIMKVMSKMGISTVRSYHGAQIFEALGLNTNFINKFFVNTPTRIGGIGLVALPMKLWLVMTVLSNPMNLCLNQVVGMAL